LVYFTFSQLGSGSRDLGSGSRDLGSGSMDEGNLGSGSVRGSLGSGSTFIRGSGISGSGSMSQTCVAFNASITSLSETDLSLDKLVVAMDSKRNTNEYKTRATNFFKNRFGIDVANAQGISMVPVKQNPDIHEYVTAAYADQLPQVSLPTSNIQILKDLYGLVVTDDQEHALGGKFQGKKIKKGDILGYGEMRFVDQNGSEIMPKIIFSSLFPLRKQELSNQSNTTDDMSWKWTDYIVDLTSPVWGKGLGYGLIIENKLGNKNRVQTRLTYSFPSFLSDLTSVPRVTEKCFQIRSWK